MNRVIFCALSPHGRYTMQRARCEPIEYIALFLKPAHGSHETSLFLCAQLKCAEYIELFLIEFVLHRLGHKETSTLFSIRLISTEWTFVHLAFVGRVNLHTDFVPFFS